MTMEPHAAAGKTDRVQSKETDQFYGDRRNGAGLYAEVSHREEPRTLPMNAPEQEG